MNKREQLAELGYEDSIVFDNPSYDESIVGVTIDGRVVYSYEKMIEELSKNDEMSIEDASDFLEYNTIRSLDYCDSPYKPLIIYEV